MRINSFSAIQRNNYRGKNKQVSFGLPPVIEKMNLSENITIPTPMRISQEALKAEIKLSERENSTSSYDAGFADHHND